MTRDEETLSERIRALHARIAYMCLEPGKGIDTMRMVQIYSGMVCELLLEYELPGEMMASFMGDMAKALRLEDGEIVIEEMAFPPIYVLDKEIEFGRSFAREITFDNWDDVHDGLKTLSNLIVHDFNLWEEVTLDKKESYALFHECLRFALAFEFAAQDICDMLIEEKIGKESWSLGDCISGFSAIAGYQAGLGQKRKPPHRDPISEIDEIIFILTQEATRLGVPGGKDWRAGLAANDMPINPPMELIDGALPLCMKYAAFIDVSCDMHIAALVAKACGRMIAVAAGGDFPEIEPAIAKPLAMMALTESHRYQEDKKFGSEYR